jgi:hypothetical protein
MALKQQIGLTGMVMKTDSEVSNQEETGLG